VLLVTTHSYTCINDECPDLSKFPVMLFIPFGDLVGKTDGAPCDRSYLAVDILADRILGVSRWDCTPDGINERVLVESKSSGG
jgi:hypothetical protein